MEAPQSPEVTMARSTAVIAAELARSRAHVRALAEELEAIVERPGGMPTVLGRLADLILMARKFLEE